MSNLTMSEKIRVFDRDDVRVFVRFLKEHKALKKYVRNKIEQHRDFNELFLHSSSNILVHSFFWKGEDEQYWRILNYLWMKFWCHSEKWRSYIKLADDAEKNSIVIREEPNKVIPFNVREDIY